MEERRASHLLGPAKRRERWLVQSAFETPEMNDAPPPGLTASVDPAKKPVHLFGVGGRALDGPVVDLSELLARKNQNRLVSSPFQSSG
jgi:hypothetical protein